MSTRPPQEIADAILAGSWNGSADGATRAGVEAPGGLPLPVAVWIGGLVRMARGFNASSATPTVGAAFCRQASEVAQHREWEREAVLGSRIGVLVLNGMAETSSYMHIGRGMGGVNGLVSLLQKQHGLLDLAVSGGGQGQPWTWTQHDCDDIKRCAQTFLSTQPAEIGRGVGQALGGMGAAMQAHGGKHGAAAFIVARLAMRGLGLDPSGAALEAALEACMAEASPDVLRAACMVGWMDGFSVMLGRRWAHRLSPAPDLRISPEACSWMIACSALDPMDDFIVSGIVVEDAAQRIPWVAFRNSLSKACMHWSGDDEVLFRNSLAKANTWVQAWPVTTTPGRRFGITGRDPRPGLETLDALEQALAIRKSRERLGQVDGEGARRSRRMA